MDEHRRMSGAGLRVLAKLLGIQASWPGSVFKHDELVGRITKAEPQNGVELAPGYVICDGSHDSCWRNNALSLEGHPWHPSKQNPDYKDQTIYMRHVKDVKVYSVSIEGPTGGIWGDREGRWEALRDGRWENPSPDTLTGPWAVYTAVACLVGVLGRTPPVDLYLDTGLQYYRAPKASEDCDRRGLVATSERRVNTAYRIDGEGRVVATARDRSKVGLPSWDWSKVEPHPLGEQHHLEACGVSAAKIRRGHVEITHLWPR